jgi:hypothetical protein
MKLQSKLAIATLCFLGAGLAGCASPQYVSPIAPLSAGPSNHAENAQPSSPPTIFMVGGGPIHEYALIPNQGPQPLRTVADHYGFIGIDALGDMYFTRQRNYECNSPCRVTVYDIMGRFKRAIRFPAMAFPYVDKTGSIYGVISSCSRIAQYAANAVGAPQPIRQIHIQPVWCERPSTGIYSSHWRLFADKLGRVYFLAGETRANQPLNLYIWPRAANGIVRPMRRTTNTAMLDGILGVLGWPRFRRHAVYAA